MKTEELIDAIKGNDAARASALLDEDRNLLTAKSGDTSAILLALYHGKPDIARLFVERGAKLTFAEAVAIGDEEKVRAMLAADPALANAWSDDGYPALGLAVFFRHPAIARLLIERGAGINAAARNPQKVAPVHAATAVRDLETLRLLLERGADPNARQQQGFVPLMTAAVHGDTEMAQLLIDHGADRNARTDDGKSVAGIARDKGQNTFVAWLAKV